MPRIFMLTKDIKMTERFLKILESRPTSFSEFHALACKSMPDAVINPEMYDLCYDLMKLTWNAAILSALKIVDEKL